MRTSLQIYRRERKGKISTISNLLIILGFLLISINIAGLFNYTTVDIANSRRITLKERISENEFWKNADKTINEYPIHYTERIVDLVYRRMVHVDPEFTRPSFFENYLLWAYAKNIEYFQWRDVRKAVRLGGGLCSQQAMVVTRLLLNNGIKSRMIGVNGHILNEALIDKQWIVLDSDYNVIIYASLDEIEDNPELIAKPYFDAGLSENEISALKGYFASKYDNWHYLSPAHYSVRDYVIERLASFFVWIIPSCLIGLGVLLRLIIQSIASTNSRVTLNQRST